MMASRKWMSITYSLLNSQEIIIKFYIIKLIITTSGQFKEIRLKDYRGKYVVLFFYPLDFTFVCPTEIIAFSEAAAQFKKINCEVIAASTGLLLEILAEFLWCFRFCLFSLGMDQHRPKTRRFGRDENPNFG